MGKKPLQFQVPEKIRDEIEQLVREKEVTLSELLRQSVKLYMILSGYSAQGYRIVLRKDDNSEKEIILP